MEASTQLMHRERGVLSEQRNHWFSVHFPSSLLRVSPDHLGAQTDSWISLTLMKERSGCLLPEIDSAPLKRYTWGLGRSTGQEEDVRDRCGGSRVLRTDGRAPWDLPVGSPKSNNGRQLWTLELLLCEEVGEAERKPCS